MSTPDRADPQLGPDGEEWDGWEANPDGINTTFATPDRADPISEVTDVDPLWSAARDWVHAVETGTDDDGEDRRALIAAVIALATPDRADDDQWGALLEDIIGLWGTGDPDKDDVLDVLAEHRASWDATPDRADHDHTVHHHKACPVPTCGYKPDLFATPDRADPTLDELWAAVAESLAVGEEHKAAIYRDGNGVSGPDALAGIQKHIAAGLAARVMYERLATPDRADLPFDVRAHREAQRLLATPDRADSQREKDRMFLTQLVETAQVRDDIAVSVNVNVLRRFLATPDRADLQLGPDGEEWDGWEANPDGINTTFATPDRADPISEATDIDPLWSAARDWVHAVETGTDDDGEDRRALIAAAISLATPDRADLPQHSALCAAQDDDAECICGVSDAYALGLRDCFDAARSPGLDVERLLRIEAAAQRVSDARVKPADVERAYADPATGSRLFTALGELDAVLGKPYAAE